MAKQGDTRQDGRVYWGTRRGKEQWVSVKQFRAWRECSLKWGRDCVYSSKSGGRNTGRVGAACELLVRADLCARGYEVTVPVNPAAQHDLHVELPSVGWVGVQVKAARLNPTGVLTMARGRIASPILALVYLPGRRIEYRGSTKELPEELSGQVHGAPHASEPEQRP